jgi:hypothetical protein
MAAFSGAGRSGDSFGPGLQDLVDHARVLQPADVAGGLALGDALQDGAHDLARRGARQAAEVDQAGRGALADLAAQLGTAVNEFNKVAPEFGKRSKDIEALKEQQRVAGMSPYEYAYGVNPDEGLNQAGIAQAPIPAQPTQPAAPPPAPFDTPLTGSLPPPPPPMTSMVLAALFQSDGTDHGDVPAVVR